MLKRRNKFDGVIYIYGREAARILGIHRDTFRLRIKHRKYDIFAYPPKKYISG